MIINYMFEARGCIIFAFSWLSDTKYRPLLKPREEKMINFLLRTIKLHAMTTGMKPLRFVCSANELQLTITSVIFMSPFSVFFFFSNKMFITEYTWHIASNASESKILNLLKRVIILCHRENKYKFTVKYNSPL